MHILPSSKIPFEKVPLDVLIAQKLTFKKKADKKIKENGKLDPNIDKPVNPRESEANELGLILIDEYEFPHAIFQVSESDLNVEGLQYGYKKCLTFLGLQNKQQMGLTVVITPNWMFMA